MARLFGTDGIRGVANAYPMDVESAVKAGRAIARYFSNGSVDEKFLLIGQDTRLSGDMIAQAVAAGVCSAGMDVAFTGVLPTPAVAYLAADTNAAAGVVISASHNPFSDNGIKVFDASGYKLSDQAEIQIEALLEGDQAHITRDVASKRIGRQRSMAPAQGHDRYIEFLLKSIEHLSLKGLHIVLDCANGATFQVAPKVFGSLGAKFTSLFCTPDGININEGCGSQHPEVLSQKVIETKADLGLAFDGDGDRLIVVDENGSILTGDQIMAVCARDLKSKGALLNDVVVSTVMSNMGLHHAMKGLGITLVTTQVGDRYVMQEMVARNAILGGENSGHMIFKDHHTTGDGIMAALRLLDALTTAGRQLSELSRIMTVFPQKLINVDVQAKPELNTVPEILDVIRNVERELGEDGRVLVRYSGTQPQCRVMVEGLTEGQTADYCERIAEVVKNVLG